MASAPRHEAKAGFDWSLWSATAPPGKAFPRLAGEVRAEVAVIGGGYAGLSTAYELAKRGVDVVVLEAREPGWGASGRNNGGVVPDLAFAGAVDLEQAYGAERGVRLRRLVDGSAEHLRALVAELGEDCGLVLNGFLDAAHRPERVGFLKARFDSLVRRGLKARWLDEEESRAASGSPLYCFGGYLLEGAGHVHPLKLARALARGVDRRGGRIFADSTATSLAAEAGGWRVFTAGGAVLAGKLVLAQNAYADRLWPGLRGGALHVRAWLAATPPLPAEIAASIIPGDHLLGDSHPGPYFFRKDSDGRLSSAVMRGIRSLDAVPDLARMQALVAETFPQIGPVAFEHVWQGITTIQPGELPKIARLAEGLYAAYGFGRGVTMANAAGPLVADIVTGADTAGAVLPVSEFSKIRFGGLIDRLLPTALRLMNARG